MPVSPDRPIQNNSYIRFSFPLSEFLDENGAAVPLSAFADAINPTLCLVTAAGVALTPLAATLDTGSGAEFYGFATVNDQAGHWKKQGPEYVPKLWRFQFAAHKNGATAEYRSGLITFRVLPNSDDV